MKNAILKNIWLQLLFLRVSVQVAGNPQQGKWCLLRVLQVELRYNL